MDKPSKRTLPNPSPPWNTAVLGLGLVLLVIVAYLPALRGQFIWDDDFHVVKSVPLRSLAGLWRIWFEPGATQQYYPLTHSTFWLDYHLWGLHPLAYHAENILLHALAAVLLWRLLRRLDVSGAWLGAALFALHPVCVESVAWITERKNALSGVCFLAAMLAAFEFWLPSPALRATKAENGAEISEPSLGRWKFYWIALFLYLCGLWSKTATLGLPAVILLLAWWKRRRVTWRDGILLAPFVALGVALGLVTNSIEHQFIANAANAEDWHFSLVQRCLIAGRALWFYLGKLCWPHPLIFMYPRWKIETESWPGLLALAAVAIGWFLLWRKRQTWARPVLTAVGYFVIMLFPVLGFFNAFPFRYSFVADHFQYLAAIGPLALAAAGITSALKYFPKENALVKSALIGALLLTLGVLTWRQTGIYYNLETIWRDTLAHNPGAWMAHDNLGIYLSESGRFEEADRHYRAAIKLRPNDQMAYYDLGLESAMQGNLDQAAENFVKSLEIFPRYALAHYQLGNVLTRQGNLDEAIHEYTLALQADPRLALAHFNLANALAKKGRLDEAIQHYLECSRLDPKFVAAPFSLGNILADQGKLDEALAVYARIMKTQPDYAPAHVALGRILAAQHHVDESISQYRKALAINPNSVDALANLGNALVNKNELEEAVTCYRTALQLAPRNAVVHYDLAVALNRQGKEVEARAEWEEAKLYQAPASTNK
jgi:tetratricopeptide (TPR) repeat protein